MDSMNETTKYIDFHHLQIGHLYFELKFSRRPNEYGIVDNYLIISKKYLGRYISVELSGSNHDPDPYFKFIDASNDYESREVQGDFGGCQGFIEQDQEKQDEYIMKIKKNK